MNWWLKLIGTHQQPWLGNYDRDYVESQLNMNGIRPGDHMILYAVGTGGRIFALAEVTSEAYPSPSGETDWPYRVDIECIVNLPASCGVPIVSINTPRNLIGPIQMGSSYFSLSQSEYEQAVVLLQAAASHPGAVPN